MSSSFHNCMRAAQMQGEIGKDQADALIERFEEYRKEFAAAAAPDPAAAAREALARERAEMASQKLRRATLTMEAQGRIRNYLENHLDLKGQHDVMDAVLNLIRHHGAGAGTTSIAGRAHSQINEMLGQFRRSRLTGKRFNQPGVDDVVREVLGESTGKAEAKAM